MFISCTSNKFSIYFIIIQIFKECGTLFSNMTSEDGAKCPDGRTKSWKIQWTNESLPEDRNSHNPTPWRVGSANTSRWVSELIKTSDCLYLECWGLEGLITSLFLLFTNVWIKSCYAWGVLTIFRLDQNRKDMEIEPDIKTKIRLWGKA